MDRQATAPACAGTWADALTRFPESSTSTKGPLAKDTSSASWSATSRACPKLGPVDKWLKNSLLFILKITRICFSFQTFCFGNYTYWIQR
jgi:hypothetical protein